MLLQSNADDASWMACFLPAARWIGVGTPVPSCALRRVVVAIRLGKVAQENRRSERQDKTRGARGREGKRREGNGEGKEEEGNGKERKKRK